MPAGPNVGRSLETGAILGVLTVGLAITGLLLSPTVLAAFGLPAATEGRGNALYVTHLALSALLVAFTLWHLVPLTQQLARKAGVGFGQRAASWTLLALVGVEVATGFALWRRVYVPLGKAVNVYVHLAVALVILAPLAVHALRGGRVWLARRAARRAALAGALERGRAQEALAQQSGVTRRLFLRLGAYALAGVALAYAFGSSARQEIEEWRLNSIGRTPQITKESYRLKITGLVNKPITLTWDDLMRMRQVELAFTHRCVEGWTYSDTFVGVPLQDVIAAAGGYKAGARMLIFKSPETSRDFRTYGQQYTTSFPSEDGLRDDMLLVHKAHGEDLPPEHGFPMRLMTPSKWGYKACKWLTEIEVSADARYRGYWERLGYHPDGDYPGRIFG